MPIRALPLGVFSGPFGNNCFSAAQMWFRFVLFLFSMFVFYFFSSVWEILLRTTTFYILDRFQELADGFCLFVFKEKACFLTDLIFCNTSILKYRKENDIF